ncbi:MAG: UDP-N-acetylmuramoyl-tripeptide--D-alanyl-D-alanine ligase [Merdibacter sp.]
MIGITGSNGKTSVKDILSSMLSRRYVTGKTKGNRNNEIGVPLTLLELSEEDQVAVVEMGMENRGEIDLLTRMVKPDIAIITNVGEAHLENLGSLENIARAKAEIVHGLKENGVLLYNGEQPVLSAALAAEQLPAGVTVESFGSSREQDLFSYGRIQQGADGLRFCTNLMAAEVYMNVYGAHQVLNALPAIYAAKALGLSEEEILAGLAHIEKTGMRNDVIAVRQGWILDDSYKSNRQSALAALKTLHDFDVPRRVAALSDMLDMGEAGPMLHYAVGKAVAEYASIDCAHGRDVLLYGTGRHQCRHEGCHPFETKEAISDR